MSTQQKPDRLELLQGTLDLLILRTLVFGPVHGHAIAKAIEQPVHLFLHVKVREGWGDDPERYREMGLEFPKE